MDKHQQQHHEPRAYIPDELPEELLRTAQFYAVQPVPQPTREGTQLLMERLLREQATTIQTARPWRVSRLQVLQVARWHIKLLGPWFWLIGVLLLMGSFVLAPSVLGGERTVNVLIMLLPLTAILSVIHAVRALSLRVHEVEASCPTNIVETAAGLVIAIVFFDALLGLVATTALTLAHWAAFGTLLITWLGPLLLLVGISLPVALRWGTLPAILIGGGPWGLLISIAFLQQNALAGHVSLLPQTSIQLALCGLSALVGLSLLLWLFLRGRSWQRYLLQYE